MGGTSIQSEMSSSSDSEEPLIPPHRSHQSTTNEMPPFRMKSRPQVIIRLLQLLNIGIFLTSLALLIYSAVS
jgi:hypothetical protein